MCSTEENGGMESKDRKRSGRGEVERGSKRIAYEREKRWITFLVID